MADYRIIKNEKATNWNLKYQICSGDIWLSLKKKKAQNFQESWSFSRLECYVM